MHIIPTTFHELRPGREEEGELDEGAPGQVTGHHSAPHLSPRRLPSNYYINLHIIFQVFLYILCGLSLSSSMSFSTMVELSLVDLRPQSDWHFSLVEAHAVFGIQHTPIREFARALRNDLTDIIVFPADSTSRSFA